MSIRTPLAELGMMFNDVYPYPTDDARLWIYLFAEAYQRDRELYARLIYLRGTGVSLVETKGSIPYKIVPIIDVDKGWSSQAEYDEERKCLIPFKDMVIECLKAIK